MSADPTKSRPGHEAVDAGPRFVGLIAGTLAALLAAGLLVGWAFASAAKGGAPFLRRATPFQDGPQSRSDVERAWADYERETRAHLSGYGWVDRPAGVVRIPIGRAIDMVCAEEAHKSAPAAGSLPPP
jgi:hypothetical protein